ncbi:MAG: hypothetical protein P8O70_14830 [SAR324 cluster bacterium]|nr:hypothetical protein [SAR324 cluster bacterium]
MKSKNVFKYLSRFFLSIPLIFSFASKSVVALTLDEGAYLILNQENRTFQFQNREEEFDLEDGRMVQLKIDGTYEFTETGQRNIRLQDGRILMLQSDQSYGYFEGESILMPNGLTLMLRPDSTYQLNSANEQLFPLRNGKLILLKQNNQYEYIEADSDFRRFWNPRIIELESELCRITLREEEDLQRVMNLQMELDRIVEYMQIVGSDKQIDLLTRERLRTVYSPKCKSAS